MVASAALADRGGGQVNAVRDVGDAVEGGELNGVLCERLSQCGRVVSSAGANAPLHSKEERV